MKKLLLIPIVVFSLLAIGAGASLAEPRDDLTIIQLKAPSLELGEQKLQKYFDMDLSQDFEEKEIYVWTTLGLRKDWFDVSVGWGQQLDPKEAGTVTLSLHLWW